MANQTRNNFNVSLTVLAAAASMLAGCSGTSGTGSSVTPDSKRATPVSAISGVVTATAFIPGSTTNPNIMPGYYQGAMVCVDANGNGKCDPSENPVTTSSTGAFSLPITSAPATIIVDTGTTAINTATGLPVPTRTVLRASLAQINDQGNGLVISPLSSEVQTLVEGNGTTYATEKANLAARLGVPAATILTDVNTVSGAPQTAMLSEANAVGNRLAYAITKLDRGDLYPDALAVPGGDPRLATISGVTPATVTVTSDPRTPITFLQSQQAAFNVEGVPRYDNVFVVMMENKATLTILNSTFAPNINALLQSGNQLVSYYATGNPSEPNYTALGGGDDFGITDDDQWNTNATGANAPQDLPLPTNTQPGLANSPFTATSSETTSGLAVDHNIVGSPHLFTALTSAGLTWRTYSESMNPGQDFRTDSVGDAAVVATDHVYAPGTAGQNTATIGNPNLNLPFPATLYKTKHNPGMAYQSVRSEPDFKFNNRTLGGGQWDAALASSTAYAIPPSYNYDQLSTDLTNGNVGTLNFIVPDQCDDMHGITVTGTVAGSKTAVTASDCSSVANNFAPLTDAASNPSAGPIITRGDNFIKGLVAKIEASPLWQNQQRRVAIVLMFDEGNATSGLNSCCGWNPDNGNAAEPLVKNANGTYSPNPAVVGYHLGNRGHGQSIFGILTNQPNAPKGIKDSDAYSHFAFNRTLQDMFQLADPAIDSSYMNRTKYSEYFVASNILNLPEYAGAADTHFDSVRPINHAYVIPGTYTQVQSSDVNTAPQVGPDTNQVSVWALK